MALAIDTIDGGALVTKRVVSYCNSYVMLVTCSILFRDCPPLTSFNLH